MFISVENKESKRCAVCAFAYLAVSLFCLLFGAVYESFSHGVYSNAMVYAFAFPLCLGTVPYFGALAFLKKPIPRGAAAHLWAFGIATLTVGSILRGVLEIYGTDSDLLIAYPIAGGALLASALTVGAIGCALGAKNKKSA